MGNISSKQAASCSVQVAQREAEESARKAARKDAADRIYDRLRLEKEAALRAKVGQCALDLPQSQ